MQSYTLIHCHILPWKNGQRRPSHPPAKKQPHPVNFPLVCISCEGLVTKKVETTHKEIHALKQMFCTFSIPAGPETLKGEEIGGNTPPAQIDDLLDNCLGALLWRGIYLLPPQEARSRWWCGEQYFLW